MSQKKLALHILKHKSDTYKICYDISLISITNGDIKVEVRIELLFLPCFSGDTCWDQDYDKYNETQDTSPWIIQSADFLLPALCVFQDIYHI